jgi:hypothetical protein
MALSIETPPARPMSSNYFYRYRNKLLPGLHTGLTQCLDKTACFGHREKPLTTPGCVSLSPLATVIKELVPALAVDRFVSQPLTPNYRYLLFL